ncbi:MAG: hypothetical protein QF744_07540, partial [SAR202 cluster bacterium]|nr:hypothetical protein [SAR202 cluster bacterium]
MEIYNDLLIRIARGPPRGLLSEPRVKLRVLDVFDYCPVFVDKCGSPEIRRFNRPKNDFLSGALRRLKRFSAIISIFQITAVARST